MKKVLYSVLAFWVFIITACGQQSIQTEDGYSIILIEDANMLKNENAVVMIDARSKQDFADGNIHRSVNVPVEELEVFANSQLTDKEKVIIIFGQTLEDSEAAAMVLVEMGYTNVKIFGGYEDWIYDVYSRGKMLPPPAERNNNSNVHESEDSFANTSDPVRKLEIAYFNMFGKSSVAQLVEWYTEQYGESLSVEIVVSELHGPDEIEKLYQNGEIPDLILLDKQTIDMLVSPYDWIKNGYIAELSSFFEEDETYDVEDYFVGITEAGKVKEGRYMVPLALRTSYLMMKEGVKEYSTLGNLEEEAQSVDIISAIVDEFNNYQEAGTYPVESKYAYTMSADYNLVLYEMLEQTGALQIDWESGSVAVDEDIFQVVTEYVKLQKQLASETDVWSQNIEAVLQNSTVIGSNANPTHVLYQINCASKEISNDEVTLLTLPLNQSEDEFAFSASMVGMISAEADCPDEAYDVIRAIMDIQKEEWQGIFANSAVTDIPVRLDVNEEMIEKYTLEVPEEININDQIFDAVPFSYEQAESLKEYYRNVRRIYIIDSNIYSRCGSIFRDLLSDEIGDSGVLAEVLRNEIQAYINE